VNDLYLTEAGQAVQARLDLDVVQRLIESKAVVATPIGAGFWELRASQKVGTIRIGELTVWIRPKVPISRLLWMLGWATKAVFESPGPVDLDDAAELVPALAEAFCRQAERAIQTGLLQGYREVDSSESVLRGRLRAGDQLGKRFGFPLPLLVRFDDHLTDIPENQILKAAAGKLLTLVGVGEDARVRLRKLRGALADVSPLPMRGQLPAWHPNRLNARYHDALRLATVILGDGSLEQAPGHIRVDGFLIDLFHVFENFVTATLGTALSRNAGSCQTQDPFTLDDGGAIEIQPDLVWRVDDVAWAVVDAKYKAEKPSGFAQADLYQAFAYATAYGLDHVHLVYAKGNQVAQDWTVRNTGVIITAHTLDLDQDGPAILGQIDRLAERISGIATALDPLVPA